MKTNKFYYWLLTISAVVLLFNSTQLSAQTCTPPPAGMVAWFPGDGNANDIQGSNNGTPNGGVTFPTGKVAQAFNFDGTGSVAYSNINAGTSYTIDFWMRPTHSASDGLRQDLVGNNISPQFGVITFAFGGIEYYQGFANSTADAKVFSGVNSIPYDTYTHVTLTYDGSVNRLYINGNLVSTSGVHSETFNNPIRLSGAGNERFFGQLDEVEIFSRALSQTEIQAIVSAGSAGKCKPAVPYVVNTTSDTTDGACNATHCSLREAITAANANPERDTITFNIAGAGVQTINVGSTGLGVLPFVANPVDINGYTQPGSSVNTATDGTTNAVLLIELNGQSISTPPINAGLGFAPNSAGSTVRGLVINRFAGSSSSERVGIRITASNIFVAGCFIGTDSTGEIALPNDTGVSLSGSGGNNFPISGVRIGSAAPQDRNVISGNRGTTVSSGIQLFPRGSQGNFFSITDLEISGNLIGTNALGTNAVPNETGILFDGFGSSIMGSTNVRIGLPVEGGGNVISGNLSDGIVITVGNEIKIRNNRIGTNLQGTAAVPNGSNPTPGTIFVGRSGIYMFPLTTGQIGGTNANEGNLISGNFSKGVYLSGPFMTPIQGNLIGTNASGTAAIGNFDGVFIEGSNSTIIGGTTVGARNIISGNRDDGIDIRNSRGTVVQGNYIGTDASGTNNLGNNKLGAGAGFGTLNSTIGGTTSGAGNIIAFNGGGGVFVSGDSTKNSILSNSTFSNTDLGIDLNPNGVTPNDTGDTDTGGNNLQNYPVLTAAMSGASAATVQGTFNSTPSTIFRVEFFSNPACDSSGFGEGQTFIGTQSVTTDASGNATVSFTSSGAVAAGQFITSTATDPNGNTSEFSACRLVLAPTAATVSVGGRITTSSGFGISQARVSITDAKGETRTVLTNQSGYYRFDEAEAGQTYIVSVSRKRYQFVPSTQVISVSEDLTGVDFIASTIKLRIIR